MRYSTGEWCGAESLRRLLLAFTFAFTFWALAEIEAELETEETEREESELIDRCEPKLVSGRL